MVRNILIFLAILVGTFAIDQAIKVWAMNAVNGEEFALIKEGACINLQLYYNDGVAFSLLSFLGDNLKWLQVVLIFGLIGYAFYEGYVQKYTIAIALVAGGALGNLYDRFIHEGVVDYIAWHCGFNFAIFNYADIIINIGVALILLQTYLEYRQKKSL